ncbi:hypothetical protein D9M68_291440 [compost metagenome]
MFEHPRAGVALAFLREAIDGQRRALVRLPGKGGLQQVAVVGDVVVGLAVPEEPDDAIKEIAIGHCRPADVEGGLGASDRAILQLDLAVRLLLGHLRYAIDDAADAGRTVHDRDRALEDLDPLEAVDLRWEGAVVHVGLAQAIAEVAGRRRLEAADVDLVEARIEAEGAGGDAGGVTRRLDHVLHAALFEFLARDHRDGAGRFDQRRVGLQRRDVARRHDCVVILSDRRGCLAGGHLDFFQPCRLLAFGRLRVGRSRRKEYGGSACGQDGGCGERVARRAHDVDRQGLSHVWPSCGRTKALRQTPEQSAPISERDEEKCVRFSARLSLSFLRIDHVYDCGSNDPQSS